MKTLSATLHPNPRNTMAKKVKKRELGRGIKALLQDYDAAPSPRRTEVVKELNSEPFRIPVDAIEPNPYQPRVVFNEDALAELSASIKALDVIQPLTVRRVSEGRYQLISGERRLRASRLAGLADVPAYVRTADDQGMLEMAIVENIQRADLNPIETAIGYQRLIDEVGLTHEALSERMGKQRSTITNSLRLLRLPPELQQALKAKRISAGHGRALAGLDDIAMQLTILRQVEREGWNVRQTEEQVKRITQPKATKTTEPTGPTGLSPVLADIQRQLAAHYGSKVSLKRQANGKGEFVIQFGSDDEFNRILEKLRGE